MNILDLETSARVPISLFFVNQGKTMNLSTQVALSPQTLSISEFIAPLTPTNFRVEMKSVEQQLKTVYQTLAMLRVSHHSFEVFLNEMLNAITLKIGELLGADRTTVFLIDEEQNELWSLVAKDEGKGSLEIRVPLSQGIVGQVARSKQKINIPFDFYEYPEAASAKALDQKNGYRTYTMLTLPLFNEEGKLVAVVELLNKLKKDSHSGLPLQDQIDFTGFSTQDEILFTEFSPLIQLIIESSQFFYDATQKQRAAEALLEATRCLASSRLNLEETLKRVMNEAKKLMNADRSTIWLLNDEKTALWAKLPQQDGTLKTKTVQVGQGFAGMVAQTGKPVNIAFDLYNHPDAETSKKMDQTNGYRTCSLLCMPVFNADGELIGVTQLVNKCKQGDFPNYDPANWPNAPECFKASFNRSDQDFMEAFNIQAGVAIQNAKLFETVKQQYAKIQQQEQMQRDILRSLTNGVISTNSQGEIIAANPSANRLLGFSETDSLEGKSIFELVRLKGADFPHWFNTALTGNNEKSLQQFYPDQTLISGEKSESSVHLSINSIADVGNQQNIYGALVVMDDVSDEKRLKSTMYRYMTQELAEQLLASGDAKLGGDRKEVSVLFSDIRGYTNLVESMDAEAVVGMLNEYFNVMVEPIFKHKGTLDKYMGDAIMGVFGSPIPLEDHAWKAVQTALDMRSALVNFNQQRIAQKQSPIRIGIGIHSGNAISGNIGHSRRMEFTVIGDDVNLGSRLEGTTKRYNCDIIISGSTYQFCADWLVVRELDIVRVKGKTQPVSLYELVGEKSAVISDQKLEAIALYEAGRKAYLNRDFTTALGQFAAVLSLTPEDSAATLHIQRCQHWLKTSLPFDWDGVENLTEK